jgi:hypothetical protein
MWFSVHCTFVQLKDKTFACPCLNLNLFCCSLQCCLVFTPVHLAVASPTLRLPLISEAQKLEFLYSYHNNKELYYLCVTTAQRCDRTKVDGLGFSWMDHRRLKGRTFHCRLSHRRHHPATQGRLFNDWGSKTWVLQCLSCCTTVRKNKIRWSRF